MSEIHGNETELRWVSFIREAGETSLHNSQAVVEIAARLLADWGSNKADMYLLLTHGVQCGALKADVLAMWKARLGDGGFYAEDGAPPQPPSALLPPQLAAIERAIGECNRKQGRQALEMGHKLLLAREQCAHHGYSFEAFLRGLQKSYGINRATCYNNLRIAQWNLPDGLGTAVMKWIVQGFSRGSAAAQQVITAALEEGLTLDVLKARFGQLRRSQHVQQAAPARGGDLKRLILLLRKREQLEQLRTQLEDQIRELEGRLQQRVSPTSSASQRVAAYDMLCGASPTPLADRSTTHEAFSIASQEHCKKLEDRPCSPSS